MTETWPNATLATNGSVPVRAEPYSEQDSLDVLVPVSVAYAIIFVAGVVGNVSTCVVIARNRSMHTATNYYLFSLAVSDLLLLVSGLPPDAHHVWHPDTYPLGEVACVALGLVSETAVNATVLTITAFTVERYIAICHPFISHTMSKLTRVVRFIAAIWAVAICAAIPQVMQFGVVTSSERGREVTVCTMKQKGLQHAFIISSFVFFVGPMTMITVLYALIGVKLRTSRVLHPPKKLSIESNGRGGGGSTRYRNGASQRRVIRMLVAVALSFFVCWAPFHAQRLMAVYGTHVEHTSALFLQVYQVLTYLSGVLYFLSTAINPLLYSIMSNKFREAFRGGTDFAGRAVYDFALAHGLTQLVKQPTRFPDRAGDKSSLLDLLLTTDPTTYQISVTAPLGTSDHGVVRAIVPYSPPEKRPPASRKVWHYASADWDGMREFFSSFPWRQLCFNTTDPSACADAISEVILDAMDAYIPNSSKSLGGMSQPWFNSECAKAIASKQAAHRVWLRARSRRDPDENMLKQAYNIASRTSKKTLAKARFEHINRIGKKLIEHPTGSRQFWSLAKAVEANFCRSSLPPLQRPNGSLAFSAKEKARGCLCTELPPGRWW